MTRRTLNLTASLVAVIDAVGFVATDRALAAEPHIAGMQVISSAEPDDDPVGYHHAQQIDRITFMLGFPRRRERPQQNG